MKPLSYIAAIALSLFAVISAQGQTIKKYVGKCSVPVSNAIPENMYGTGYYHYYEKDGKRVWHGRFHIERNEFVERFTNNGTLPMITSCSPGWVKYIEDIIKNENDSNIIRRGDGLWDLLRK